MIKTNLKQVGFFVKYFDKNIINHIEKKTKI